MTTKITILAISHIYGYRNTDRETEVPLTVVFLHEVSGALLQLRTVVVASSAARRSVRIGAALLPG